MVAEKSNMNVLYNDYATLFWLVIFDNYVHK